MTQDQKDIINKIEDITKETLNFLRTDMCREALEEIERYVKKLKDNEQKDSIEQLSVGMGYLTHWYQNTVDANPPIWTDEHLKELFKDFYLIPKNYDSTRID